MNNIVHMTIQFNLNIIPWLSLMLTKSTATGKLVNLLQLDRRAKQLGMGELSISQEILWP